MQAAEAGPQATEAIRVLDGLEGNVGELHVEPEVNARVAAGGVAPKDPLVPSPSERQVI
jgi:hypothetical protein